MLIKQQKILTLDFYIFSIIRLIPLCFSSDHKTLKIAWIIFLHHFKWTRALLNEISSLIFLHRYSNEDPTWVIKIGICVFFEISSWDKSCVQHKFNFKFSCQTENPWDVRLIFNVRRELSEGTSPVGRMLLETYFAVLKKQDCIQAKRYLSVKSCGKKRSDKYSEIFVGLKWTTGSLTAGWITLVFNIKLWHGFISYIKYIYRSWLRCLDRITLHFY